jgi:excinuclease ABC subunit A
MDEIQVVGAQEHNLKCVEVSIPKRALVAFTGVSGSGKSSLIFDTIYSESYRRFSDASQVPVHLLGRNSAAPNTRPKFQSIRGLPPALGLSQRQGVAGRLSTVGTISGVADLLRVYFAAFGEVSCRNCDIPLRAMTFSDVLEAINSRFLGKKIMVLAPIAEKRKGAFADEIERFRKFGFTRIRLNGTVVRLDGPSDDLRLDARKLNTVELVIDAFQLRTERVERAERAVAQAIDFAKLVRVEVVSDFESASSKNQASEFEIFNMSSACPQCGESAPQLDPRYFSHTSLGKCLTCEGSGEELEGLPGDVFPCAACGGTRLTEDLPIVRIQAKTFGEFSRMSLSDIGKTIGSERESQPGIQKARVKVLDEVLRLTQVQSELGIGHLTLGRAGGSLAPGDLQRLRLSSLLSNRLQGAVYVLDEPCQGLTKAEVKILSSYLRRFVINGCSVLVVEHHPEFLRSVDYVYLMGPGAGEHGGQVVGRFSGSDFGKIHQNERAQTQSNARGGSGSALKQAGKSADFLRFKKIALRGKSYPEISLLPQGINLIRGPSGSGKSTFVNLVLAPYLGRICKTDEPEIQALVQGFSATKKMVVERPKEFAVTGMNVVKPGGMVRSTRRTVASAIDILVPLRQRFESLVSSQVLGLVASDFSWNTKKGQCPECQGRGYLEFEQKYAPPLEVTCSSCNGAKLARQSLLPRLRGKTFADVLDLSIDQAVAFFAHDNQIVSRLEAPREFGLGYVKLSQTMESLSGGEMQRLILTLDLKRSRVEGYWYLLTHPGTGLHLPDIAILGELMRKLVDRGATFVVTENREEFADYAHHLIEF